MMITYREKVPVVDSNAFVADNASVIGDVEIGRDSSVWFGAVIRGDHAPIRIGEGSSIQDNCVLHCEPGHAMHIGSNVTVGHGAVIHCDSIGDNVLIGMGAIVLDGARIGDNSIIGAGAVVKENAVIPENSMAVGVPAKVIRTVEGEQLEERKKQSPYVALSKEYMK